MCQSVCTCNGEGTCEACKTTCTCGKECTCNGAGTCEVCSSK